MNRRELIQRVLAGSAVLVLVPSVLQSCTKTSLSPFTFPPGNGTPGPGSNITLDLSLADNSSLNTVGNAKIVQNILIINTSSGFVALSSICTHQACTVG